METFETLYKQYYNRIFRFLSRTTSWEIAEDLTQEVFMKVQKSLSGLQKQESLTSWIYRIATNLAIDYSRTQKKEAEFCRLSDRDLFQKYEVHFLTEEFKIVQEEMHACICSFIKQLSPGYKTVLILREYEDMSVSEIARTLEKNKDTVKKTLTRARKKLKGLLEEHCRLYYNDLGQLSCDLK